MLKTELDVLNFVLRRLGEPPINSVDTQYPTLDLIRPAVEYALTSILQEGWWFNTVERYAAAPTNDGTVTLPSDTLAFYPEEDRWVWVGDSIVGPGGDPNVGTVVYGRRVYSRDLYSLPQAARQAVALAAAMQVYGEDIGIDDIYNGIAMQYATAYSELSAQHTRQRKQSVMTKPQVLRWRRHLRS